MQRSSNFFYLEVVYARHSESLNLYKNLKIDTQVYFSPSSSHAKTDSRGCHLLCSLPTVSEPLKNENRHSNFCKVYSDIQSICLNLAKNNNLMVFLFSAC